MIKYAILDYDGYICKAYFAAIAKEDMSFSKIQEILDVLIREAKFRVFKHFKLKSMKDVQVLKVISGRTFKKDLYTDYKAHRKPDEYLSMLRDYIKDIDRELYYHKELEADDIVLSLAQDLQDDCVVFSDDKDIHYYNRQPSSTIKCDKPIHYYTDNKDSVIQLVTGDSVDNIKGIPNVGKATAKKYFDKHNNYSLPMAIEMYKEYGISFEDCVKNLILVLPVYCVYVTLENRSVDTDIELFKEIITNTVRDIYERRDNDDDCKCRAE